MLLFSPVLCAIGWGSKEWPLLTHPFPNNIVWYEILLSSTYAETVLTLLYVHQTVVALGDMICCYFHLCCVLLAGEAQNGLRSSPKCQTTLYDINFNKPINILRLYYHSFVFFQSWLTIFVCSGWHGCMMMFVPCCCCWCYFEKIFLSGLPL